MFPSKGINSDDVCENDNKSKVKVRLNMILKAETARILLELKNRGVIRSYADGVNQAIRLFYDKIIEQDLRSARLKVLRDSNEGN